MKKEKTYPTATHVVPKGEKDIHNFDGPTSCRCEPVTKYLERTTTPDGFVWRRVLVHGRLGRRD
jgi:hypothetical protein